HDPLAACLLITTDPCLPDRAETALGRQLAATRHRDRVSQALAGQSACVLVDDLDAALAVADAWAPEHLEIQADDAPALAAAAPHIDALAAAEDLPAHATAVRARVPREPEAGT